MLNEILTLDIYRFFMIFTRVGAAMMLLPGMSGQLISTRIRLLMALAIALVLLPTIGRMFPPLPRQVSTLALMLASEALVGIYLGLLTQMLMASLNIAGTFIGFQVGLTNAFSFDTVSEQQSATLTAFLSNLAMAAIFATDLHHLMLRAVADSYATFVPGQPLMLDDFSQTLGHLMSQSFGFGLQMAAPLVAFGLIFYGGLGLLSRLAPQIQVFFVALPIQVLGGLSILMVALPLIVSQFLRWFEAGLIPFLAR